MHKIVKRDTLPNGVQIQLEDWGHHMTIVAYPHVVREYGFYHKGETFRLVLSYGTDPNPQTVMDDYEDLVCGDKSLADMANRFEDGYRDLWLLGMHVGDLDERRTSAIEKKAKGLIAIEEQDALLEELWAEFGDIPMDPDSETMEEDFLDFPHGTHREEIWRWFDDRYSKGVAHLLINSEGVDRIDQIAKMVYLQQLCFECETHGCVYNHDGECRYAFVHEKKPEITEEDGCKSGEIPL